MKAGDLVDGRYEILCEVASGGMATVYAARVVGAVGFEKLVALKRMLPTVSGDERYRRMFLDEARVAAHIHSPYVVSTFDLGEQSDGSLYIVMDLVVGAALSSILAGSQGRQLPIGAVATIIEQSARGMHDAHIAANNLGEPLKIVHRDISPQNLLVGIDGAARITDFGVAHAVERQTKTVGFKVKGKLSYCSPEQAQALPLDRRSDVFALGIVMWETLLLRRLYERESAAETVRVQGQPVPSPRSFRPEIPQELADIVLRALEHDPAARFQSALEMAEAIRATGLGAPTAEIQSLVREMAGASVTKLTSSIKDAIARSVVRPSSFPSPNKAPVERRTLGARTMMSLEVDPRSVASPTRVQGGQRRSEFPAVQRAAVQGDAAKTSVERPARRSPPASVQAPPQAHQKPQQPSSPGTGAERTRRLRLFALVGTILVVGALLGGVGVFAALSSAEVTPPPMAPNYPAPVAPTPQPPAPTPTPTSALPTGAATPVAPAEMLPPEQPPPTAEPPPTRTPAVPSGGAVSNKPEDVRQQPEQPERRARRGRAICDDSCQYANDHECDDGGSGSTNSVCAYGTDCADCGTRIPVSCTNTCQFAHDGQCDDGGANSSHALCPLGSDCDDCGRR